MSDIISEPGDYFHGKTYDEIMKSIGRNGIELCIAAMKQSSDAFQHVSEKFKSAVLAAVA
jgi:predicted RNase H-like HicB family nuclease